MSYFTPLQKELMNLFRSNLGISLLSMCITSNILVSISWKPHITELSKKLARSVGIFFKISHYVTLEALKLLYYSLFYSFISYCISVWGLTHPSVLDLLIKLQKTVTRAILFKDQFKHSTPLFSKLQILTN